MTINGLRNRDADFGNAWMNDHHCTSISFLTLVHGRVVGFGSHIRRTRECKWCMYTLVGVYSV